MPSFCCKLLRRFSALFLVVLLSLSSLAQTSGKATLQYSTFVGGTSSYTYKIALDSSNNVYAIGTVWFDLPTKSGAFRRYATPPNIQNPGSVFITKLNNVGTSAIISTYFGGNGNDYPFGIAVDSAHNIYIGLNTTSTDLPVVNGFQASAKGGHEIYIAKFNASANTILYSSYYGGSQDDYAGGMALDSEGRIYITGGTTSPDLPISAAAFHHTFNGDTSDRVGFLARIDPRFAGSASLSYSTYFGLQLGGAAIAVDNAFNAYVTANGFDYFYCVPQPGEGCFRRTPGTYDNLVNSENVGIYVAKFDAAGSNLLWASFFGATQAFQGSVDLKLDSMNQPVVVGYLSGDGFPTTPGAFQPTPAGYRTGWLAKLNADGTQLLWGTYMGGADGYPTGLATNSNGEVLVTGVIGNPSNFPTTPDALYPGPSPAYSGSYAAKLSNSGAAEYASYLSYSSMPPSLIGSSSAALNNKGDIFVGGWAMPDLPTTDGDYSPGSGGGFLMRIGQNGPVTCVASSSTADRSFVVCSPTAGGMTHERVRFYARAKSNAGVQKTSLFVDGSLKFQISGSLIDKTLNLSPGTHNISFVGTDADGSFSKGYSLYVNANDNPPSIACSVVTTNSVNICFPSNNATVYNAFEISAAADSSVGYINAMVLYVDGKRFFFSGGQFDLKLRVPPGTHRFTVNAWNNFGTVYTKTIYLNVKSFF